MTLQNLSELKKICWKETETIWYAKYVIRHISIRITRLILPTGISANQATVIFLITGVLGCILLGTGDLSYSIFGILLIQFSYIFDCVDGEIARYRKQSSVNGVFIDSVGHEVLTPAIFLAMTFFIFNNTHQVFMLVLGTIATWASQRPMVVAKEHVFFTFLVSGHISYYDFSKLNKSESALDLTKISKSKYSKFLIPILYYPGAMNVFSILAVFYFIYPVITNIIIGAYFVLQIVVQIALPIKWLKNGSIEKDFIKLRENAIKNYKDQSTQKP